MEESNPASDQIVIYQNSPDSGRCGPSFFIFPLSLPAKRTWTHNTSAHALVMCARWLIRLSSRNASEKGGGVHCAETQAAHVSTAQGPPTLPTPSPSIQWGLNSTRQRGNGRLGGEEKESGEHVQGRTWICGVQRNDHVLVRRWMGGLCVVPGAWVGKGDNG